MMGAVLVSNHKSSVFVPLAISTSTVGMYGVLRAVLQYSRIVWYSSCDWYCRIYLGTHLRFRK